AGIWTSPTTCPDKFRLESTGNPYTSGTVSVIGDMLFSIGNISKTSGTMSVGLLSTTGNISTGSDNCKFEPTCNGYFDGTIRCKGGLNVRHIVFSVAKFHNTGA
ncbi:MAG: hypothetical protein ACKPKO_11150, partial [Candidatus Fonsibacter sp.]